MNDNLLVDKLHKNIVHMLYNDITNFEALYCLGLMEKFSLLLL